MRRARYLGGPPNRLSTELGEAIDLPLDVLEQLQVDEARDVVLGHAPPRTPWDHEVDLAGAGDGREHDLTGSLVQDPQEDIS
jgi:hypothetical protein